MDFKKNYNLDKLKLCFKAPVEVADYFHKHITLSCEPFQIIRKATKKRIDHKYGQDLMADVYIPFNDTYDRSVLLGEIRIDYASKFYLKDSCWLFLTLDNKFLYQHTHPYPIKDTLMAFIDMLNLDFQTITAAEIACDVDFNASESLLALERDTSIPMSVCWSRVKDSTAVNKKISHDYYGSRLGFSTMTYRVHGKDTGYAFYAYDKMSEIEQSGKYYILDAFDERPEMLYRMEVRLNKDSIERLASRMHCDMAIILFEHLLDPQNLINLWSETSKRLLRYKLTSRVFGNPLEAISHYSKFVRSPKSEMSGSYDITMGGNCCIRLHNINNYSIKHCEDILTIESNPDCPDAVPEAASAVPPTSSEEPRTATKPIDYDQLLQEVSKTAEKPSNEATEPSIDERVSQWRSQILKKQSDYELFKKLFNR